MHVLQSQSLTRQYRRSCTKRCELRLRSSKRTKATRLIGIRVQATWYKILSIHRCILWFMVDPAYSRTNALAWKMRFMPGQVKAMSFRRTTRDRIAPTLEVVRCRPNTGLRRISGCLQTSRSRRTVACASLAISTTCILTGTLIYIGRLRS